MPEHKNVQRISFFLFLMHSHGFYRDLKRDVSKKLEKLERRTQRAIAELIRKIIFVLLFVRDSLYDISMTLACHLVAH